MLWASLGAWLVASDLCQYQLTCNTLSVFSRSFDFGPGISVLVDGPNGSPCTYELYRQRASVAIKTQIYNRKNSHISTILRLYLLCLLLKLTDGFRIFQNLSQHADETLLFFPLQFSCKLEKSISGNWELFFAVLLEKTENHFNVDSTHWQLAMLWEVLSEFINWNQFRALIKSDFFSTV